MEILLIIVIAGLGIYLLISNIETRRYLDRNEKKLRAKERLLSHGYTWEKNVDSPDLEKILSNGVRIKITLGGDVFVHPSSEQIVKTGSTAFTKTYFTKLAAIDASYLKQLEEDILNDNHFKKYDEKGNRIRSK